MNFTHRAFLVLLGQQDVQDSANHAQLVQNLTVILLTANSALQIKYLSMGQTVWTAAQAAIPIKLARTAATTAPLHKVFVSGARKADTAQTDTTAWLVLNTLTRW